MPFTRQLGRIQEHPHTGESVAFSHHPLTFHPPPPPPDLKNKQKTGAAVQRNAAAPELCKNFLSLHTFSPSSSSHGVLPKSTPPASKRHMLALVHALAMHARNYKKRRCQIKSLKRTQHKLADPLSSFLLCFLHPVLSSQIFRSSHKPLLQAT